ncbi:MAG: hydrogenase maturation protease [Bdellovibrionaceae bacterium]|jgi:hydrogenase maturation protease|nr:hydrogenase maturation protease [Pseudobdellovibrionaceae bacterium]
MKKDLLIYGIGNPGRQDDGLGYEFVCALDESDNYHKHHNYQLNIEDAELISRYKEVIFVDAGKNMTEVFELNLITAKANVTFSTHGLNAETLVHLCKEIYNKEPKCQLLSIKADHFSMNLGLSPQAQKHLQFALTSFNSSI